MPSGSLCHQSTTDHQNVRAATLTRRWATIHTMRGLAVSERRAADKLVMESFNLPNSVDQDRRRVLDTLVASAIEVAALDVYEGDGAA
jgi:hypothetical protein